MQRVLLLSYDKTSKPPLFQIHQACINIPWPVVQRVLLLSYDKTTKRIQLRHFSISAQPSGVSKSVKALVGQRALPDMGHVQDVSEFLSKSGYGSVRMSKHTLLNAVFFTVLTLLYRVRLMKPLIDEMID